jgi:ABC-type sulfate transport system permease subunit
MSFGVAALMMFQDDSQVPSAAAAGVGMGMMLVWLAVVIVLIAAMWKVFEKAGKPGWAAIIPIYNLVVLCEIAGKPAWWVVLFLIPFVNFIVAILVAIAIAKNFGKGGGFAAGLIFLPFIFYPMLAWGDGQYRQTA